MFFLFVPDYIKEEVCIYFQLLIVIDMGQLNNVGLQESLLIFFKNSSNLKSYGQKCLMLHTPENLKFKINFFLVENLPI